MANRERVWSRLQMLTQQISISECVCVCVCVGVVYMCV